MLWIFFSFLGWLYMSFDIRNNAMETHYFHLFIELQSHLILWEKFPWKSSWFFPVIISLQYLIQGKFVIEYPKIDEESASCCEPMQSISLKYLQLKNFLAKKTRVESTIELIMANESINDCAKKNLNLYGFFCIIDKLNSWHFTQKLSLLSLKMHATYI